VRICGVIASLGAGGAERVMIELCGAWRARGDDVTLLTLDDGQSDFHTVPSGVHRRALNLAGRSRSTSDALRANLLRARMLRAALRSARADVVVSFTDRTNVLTLLAARGLGVPVVISERIDPRRHEIGRAWSLLRRLTYPSAAALVIQTHALRRWAADVVPPARIAVIPNPLRPVSASLVPAPGRALEITAIGRLVPQKGFDLLLRAFAMVADDFPEWRLTIHGEGPERAALEGLVRELALDTRVSLPGRIADPAPALAASAIFALPSRYEGFPNVLLEAMSCGCACVAARCDSGPAELLTNRVSGLLVHVEDVLQLAESLATLMEDVDLRGRLGREAQLAVHQFAPEVVLDLWERVFAMVRSPARMAA
jgi:glycosyltransferase involved in cell wall biosynthesis